MKRASTKQFTRHNIDPATQLNDELSLAPRGTKERLLCSPLHQCIISRVTSSLWYQVYHAHSRIKPISLLSVYKDIFSKHRSTADPLGKSLLHCYRKRTTTTQQAAASHQLLHRIQRDTAHIHACAA